MKTNITKILGVLCFLLVLMGSTDVSLKGAEETYDMIVREASGYANADFVIPMNPIQTASDYNQLITQDELITAFRGTPDGEPFQSYFGSLAVCFRYDWRQHWYYKTAYGNDQEPQYVAEILKQMAMRHDITIWMTNVELDTLPVEQISIDDPNSDWEWTQVYHRDAWSWSQVRAEDPNYKDNTVKYYQDGEWGTFPLDDNFYYSGGAVLIKICCNAVDQPLDWWNKLPVSSYSSYNNVVPTLHLYGRYYRDGNANPITVKALNAHSDRTAVYSSLSLSCVGTVCDTTFDNWQSGINCGADWVTYGTSEYWDLTNGALPKKLVYDPGWPNYDARRSGNWRFDFRIGITDFPAVQARPANNSRFLSTTATDPDIPNITTPSARFCCEGNPFLASTAFFSYRILNSRGNEVFRALDPVTGNNWISVDISQQTVEDDGSFTIYFSNATGSMVDASIPGRAQLSFKRNDLAGDYTIEYVTRFLDAVSDEYITTEHTSSITALYPDNVELTGITQPQDENRIYRISSEIVPFGVDFENTGLRAIQDYTITYRVSHVVNTTVGNSTFESYIPIYDTICYINTTELAPAEIRSHRLESFIPNTIPNIETGNYALDVRIYVGQDSTNRNIGNSLRRSFRLTNSYDGSVDAVLFPSADDALYTHQAYYPQIRISNRAALPASTLTLSVICQPVNSTDTVYHSTELVLGLPAWEEYVDDNGNLVPLESVYRDVTLSRPMVLKESGSYRLTISLDTTEDHDLSNNVYTYIFTTQPSLSGTYYIGDNTSSNYGSLNDAVTGLYNRGMDDSVRFVLGSGLHRLGSAMSEYGLDLTSSIGGIDTNKPGTISIVTDPNNTERGSVTLEFSSRSGVGLYVASSTTSPYTSAPINQFTGSVNDPYGERKKDYDRFNAKLIIDGGANKALRIRMSDVLGRAVGAGNRVPIVLGRGVQNVIIRNCIIETDAVSLPRVPGVLYSAKFNNFSFRPLESVSAGILIRNELPVDRFGRNDLGIDTVLNSNILIENCEFIGGSYGVISTGIGPLYEHSTGSYVGYYNRDNVIRNNVFTGQQVAGVFLGYEQGSVVEGNVISGVNSGSYTGDAGGIILGGMGDPAVKSLGGTTGYNNFNITLNRNDINDITSNNGAAYGIKVEQTMNDFSYSHLMGNKYFTNHNDSIKIYNNAIWDINSDTEVYGIRLFGSRDTAGQSDKFVRFTDRLSSLLYLSHASIANNTVVLVPLLEHTVSTYFGGIVLQDVDTLQFYNNAISIKAPLNAPITSEIFSPLVLQSVNPSNAQVSFLMDNNIYYSRPNADNIVRFIEQDDMVPDSLLLEGLGMEYRGMDQWRRLSGAEDLSSIYDFSNILTVNTFSIPASGSSEYNYTRLGLSALSSSGLGTALNNRGRRLPFVTTDITGLPRGYATQLYDIGAWEFNSTQHDDDCEVLGFVAPLSLRSSVSPYDDAEYVMAPSKIELAVRVRNNGTSSVQERPLRLLVERQLQNGSYSEVVELTKKFSLSTGETTVVDFSDQIAALSGNSVFPRSYEDLRQNLNSRELRFSFMRNNVTPIYRYTVDVSSAGDRESNNDVNQTGKLVRYYLKKSKVSAILSVQNTMLVPPTSASNYVDWLSSRKESLIAANGEQSVLDSVSSYLNYRSLVDGFSAIGFSVDSLDYDLFDRHAWEPSSVNYANYRYMFWSDGHDSRLSSNQIRDLNLFMHDGHNLRKSIVMASEELARHTYQSVVSTPRQGQDLINIIFGTKIKGTGFYSASQGDTLRLSGNALAPNLSLFLSQTPLYLDHDLDNGYSPAIFESYGSNPSLSSRQAFYYADPLSVASIEKTFGLVSFSPNQHCVYLGADWRNFSDVSLLLESILSSMGGFLTDDASLPVELISFDASALNGAVLLDWSTSSEAHSREYVVEKLFGSTFEPIHKELANNSQRLANHYSATDMDVSAGNTYTYRLRTLSVDGSVSYSSERSVLLAGSDLVVSLGVPSPSPASSDLTINYSLSLPSSVRLTVYDLSGSAVLSLRSGGVLAAGSYTESYSVSDLPSGTYNLVLECGGVVKMQRFVVSR